MRKMNKVLVKLYVPTIEKEYDIWIPLNRRIYTVIKLIVKAIKEFTNGEYNPSKFPVLFDRKTAKPYDINLTIGESTIRNGSEIILI